MSLLRHAKACPWCAGRKVWVWDKAVPGRFAIACSNPDCVATGPIRATVDEAVIAWNAAPRGTRSGGLVAKLEREMHDTAGVMREVAGGD